jgi:hypothetical protein
MPRSSGGEVGARDGTLSIMVGGAPDALERVRPVLEVLGSTITHIGCGAAGQIAKACDQVVVGSNIEAVAEAVALARAAGVEPSLVLAAISMGLGGSVVDRYAERMLEGRFEPGARVSLHAKSALAGWTDPSTPACAPTVPRARRRAAGSDPRSGAPHRCRCGRRSRTAARSSRP